MGWCVQQDRSPPLGPEGWVRTSVRGVGAPGQPSGFGPRTWLGAASGSSNFSPEPPPDQVTSCLCLNAHLSLCAQEAPPPPGAGLAPLLNLPPETLWAPPLPLPPGRVQPGEEGGGLQSQLSPWAQRERWAPVHLYILSMLG